MFFIFAVFGGAVRTRRHWGNAAVLAELSRPAGSRKAWAGLGRGCCWFSPCKIDARAQGKPCSVGHTACGTANLAKEQRPLPSPLSSASSSNALAKLPQRIRLEEGNDAGCEREAHGGCGVAAMCPGCAHGVAPLPDLPRRHWLAADGEISVNPAKFSACLRFAGSKSTLGEREVQHLPWLPLPLWAFWLLSSTSGFVVLFCSVLFVWLFFFPECGEKLEGVCSKEWHKQSRSPARSLPAAGRGSAAISLPPSPHRAPGLPSRF